MCLHGVVLCITTQATVTIWLVRTGTACSVWIARFPMDTKVCCSNQEQEDKAGSAYQASFNPSQGLFLTFVLSQSSELP